MDQRYRRVFQLGRGGMGEVWLGVRHGAGGFRRFVVLKRIRLDGQSDEAMARFVAEARVAARLHHPNIVAVYDFGRFDAGGDASGWFIVMEYLAGASLYDVLRRAYQEQVAVPPEVILAVGIGVLRGLECAHGHGVLHRDVSPDNVIITFEGAVKLLDFGIAKDTHAAEQAPSDGDPFPVGGFMTVPGGVAGKRRYLAPERVVGDSASAESDLYSLALVMLELFGCQLPDTGADVAGTPTPLSDAGLGPPEGLDDVLSRALSSHPKRRFRSAGAMAAALRRVAVTLPAVELGPWVRELCPSRYEIARRLGKLETPDADAVEAVFRDIALPTVEVSPPQPGARPGAVEALVDRLVAVGPKIDVPPEPAVQTPRTQVQPPKPTRTPSRTIPD
ncbi:MAG: serine/threonine protein kinase [Nannocystaceae bacterium]|nr:serine/threonine protein kinase [Nannocystaceae bacterium]